ncbi:MAG: acyl-CoA dehydrogenase family protein [Alphaproteobacteria bacterium]|nr:acyl-CoA dehydrogenase family protein [Alphaproteobacteria bacterium]
MEASNSPKTSREELVARAHDLIPLVREHADQAERRRMVPAEVMDAFKQAEFFRVLQPERFGGLEYDFSMVIRIAGAIGQGCASTAWVCDLAMMHQWLVANFPLEAQEDVWGADPGAITFGSYSPVTTAEPEAGGWRIAGSWPFASGCDHGQWALLGVRFPPEKGGSKPVAGFVLVPAADYGFDDDWDTTGLAATGSKRIVCDDVFVPAHRRLDIEDAKAGHGPGALALDRPLYRIPMFAVIPTAITGPALGALEGAIKDFIAQTKVRKTIAMAGAKPMAEFAGVQSRLAEAAAALDAAKLMIFRDLAETHAVADAGGRIDLDMRLRNRLTHSYIVKLALDAINGLYEVSGIGGINRDHRIGRAWRDINAIAHHISLNWDAGSTRHGKYLLGLEPDGQF